MPKPADRLRSPRVSTRRRSHIGPGSVKYPQPGSGLEIGVLRGFSAGCSTAARCVSVSAQLALEGPLGVDPLLPTEGRLDSPSTSVERRPRF
jgi:hypothetical protein